MHLRKQSAPNDMNSYKYCNLPLKFILQLQIMIVHSNKLTYSWSDSEFYILHNKTKNK
jgi:hypothetical protein